MLAYEKVPNFLENVTVSDNSMEEITPKIEGEYDSIPGLYILLSSLSIPVHSISISESVFLYK